MEKLTCTNCGKVVESEEYSFNGNVYCEKCFSASFSCCEECGEVRAREDLNWILYGNRTLCDHCLSCYYTRCNECGRYERDDDIVTTSNFIHICQRCYEEDYFTCYACGEVFPMDEYAEDGLCNSCYASAEANIPDIKPYSYKPCPVFYRGEHDTSNLYMGIELEYETKQGSLRRLAELWTKHFPSVFYLKQDGSLAHGLEAVSHPSTLAAWNERKEAMDDLFSVIEHETDTFVTEGTGLHIHVSKRGMTDGHKVRLFAFVNGYKEEIERVARRKESSWAKIKGLSKGKLCECLRDEDRYQALNWNNESTVEFRFFRSTLNLNDLYTAIEFCHASYIFTKNNVSIASLVNGKGWILFADFVKQNLTKYPSLHKFLSK